MKIDKNPQNEKKNTTFRYISQGKRDNRIKRIKRKHKIKYNRINDSNCTES